MELLQVLDGLIKATGGAQATCGGCRHWARRPPDPANLADRRGDCRESPPAATILVGQGGQVLGSVSGYPNLPHDWPACSRFEAAASAGG